MAESKEKRTESFQVVILPGGIKPVRSSPGAAGYDLFTPEDFEIKARSKVTVPLNLMMKVPEGTYGRVAPRSGLANKHSLDVGAGVIDSDYRGNVGVILFNHSDEVFSAKKGDRIAQLILERIVTPEPEVVEKLDDTNRGEGGFGSTGV